MNDHNHLEPYRNCDYCGSLFKAWSYRSRFCRRKCKDDFLAKKFRTQNKELFKEKMRMFREKNPNYMSDYWHNYAKKGIRKKRLT